MPRSRRRSSLKGGIGSRAPLQRPIFGRFAIERTARLAGRHKLGGELQMPQNITLLHLPPYSPELNPVENIWAYLRSNKLGNRVYDSDADIVDACCDARNWLLAQPERITSISS